jgi:hypothetical protein
VYECPPVEVGVLLAVGNIGLRVGDMRADNVPIRMRNTAATTINTGQRQRLRAMAVLLSLYLRA